MTTDTDIHNLFSTPLWVMDLEPSVREQLNGRILDSLHELRHAPAAGETLHSCNDLHTAAAFSDLFALCAVGVETVLNFLGVRYTHFEFTRSWLKVDPPGAANIHRVRPSEHVSGVYHVQTTADADEILFSDPRLGASVTTPLCRELAVRAPSETSIEAREGRIVIFPSWLSHRIPVNRGNRDRISIAFNVMFSEKPER